MNFDQLIAFLLERKWVAFAAALIGLTVRLLKSDTKIPFDVPPQYRFWLAVALGGAAGALDKLIEAGDTTWTSALTKGVMAAVIAIVTHDGFIASMRGGKELVIPGLIKENTPPGPGKPPSIPPSPMNEKTMQDAAEGKPVDKSGLVRTLFAPKLLAATLVIGLVIFTSACKLFTPENLPNTILTFEKIACIIEHAFVDDRHLNTLCNLLSASEQAEGRRVAATQRAAVQRALASKQPSLTCGDGGTNDAGLLDGGGK